MAASDARYVASLDADDTDAGDDTQAIMAARSTLVQRASRAGEVHWSTIKSGLAEIVTPDVDSRTAACLSGSLVAQFVFALIRLYSRAHPSPGQQTCDSIPGIEDAVKPVQNYTLQNFCDIALWIIAIVRNTWMIRYVTAIHPVEMRSAFRLPSLVYHSILGNSSPLILELIAYAIIGFFFKIVAFTSDDGQETCSSPGGTWEAYCSAADLSSDDICADRLACHEAGSSMNTKIGENTDSVCVYTAATELHLGSYILFALQAVNYPSMFLLFTALENSFRKIKWIMLTEQLFMLLMLVDSLVLHLIYIIDVNNFSPKFQSEHPNTSADLRLHPFQQALDKTLMSCALLSFLIAGMRILSLGSFIIMRLTAYKFTAFKREMPTKAFCKEVRHDVEGMKFVPEDQRASLEAQSSSERAFVA